MPTLLVERNQDRTCGGLEAIVVAENGASLEWLSVAAPPNR
jgi:hypothetical protein